MERLNSDWVLQRFCGIRLGIGQSIKDPNIIWRTRKYVAQHLNKIGIEKYQSVFIESWKSDLEDTQIGLCDATCYESRIKYPTDVELLWDCVEWLKSTIQLLSRAIEPSDETTAATSQIFGSKEASFNLYASSSQDL